MPLDTVSAIAVQLRLRNNQVQGALQLLDEGQALVFVAHYRKEQTGGLNEDQLQKVREARDKFVELAGRKESNGSLAACEVAFTFQIL